jgi:hypothetical protein
VAQARFTVFIVPDRRVARPTSPDGWRSLRPESAVDRTRLGWRFLAANNRDVARSAAEFEVLAACIRAAEDLQRRIEDTVAVAARTGRAEWTWRLRLDAADVAVSSRTYQRRLQCEAACALFVALVGDAVVDAPPSVLVAAAHARDRRTPT